MGNKHRSYGNIYSNLLKFSKSSSKIPTRRGDGVSWQIENRFFLFGGYGVSSSEVGYLNDVWQFDGTNWTMVAGSNSLNSYSIVSGANPNPGGRRGSSSWLSDNRLWLFGGFGYHTDSNIGTLADMWSFQNGQWEYIGGPSLTKTWPSGRVNSCNWKDSNGALWLFGGITSNNRKLIRIID